MLTLKNETHIEGYLYESKLKAKVSGAKSKNPGTPFINGEISIATDDAGLNIVPVHFSYVTSTFGNGNPNSTYAVLKDIVEGKYGSIMADGKEKAVKLRIDSAIGLNEFYVNRNGEEELVSAKRNEGGFVHVVNALDEDEKNRDTFKCDILITNVRRIEADEEKQTAERVIVKGAVFDFRKALLPVELTAVSPAAMNYFESLGATSSHPVFTRVWGRQISSVVTKVYTQESAFDGAEVHEVKSTRKDFVITGAKPDTYEWDTEETMTAAWLTNAMAERETYLAGVKQRQDEYNASRENAITPVTAEVPATGAFKF